MSEIVIAMREMKRLIAETDVVPLESGDLVVMEIKSLAIQNPEWHDCEHRGAMEGKSKREEVINLTLKHLKEHNEQDDWRAEP